MHICHGGNSWVRIGVCVHVGGIRIDLYVYVYVWVCVYVCGIRIDLSADGRAGGVLAHQTRFDFYSKSF